MTLDMNKLKAQKEKLEAALSRGGGGRSAKFWRPSDNDNSVRIMPGWSDAEPFSGQFYREVAQHWGVSDNQRGPILCPKKTPFLEGACPVCDFVEELRKDKSDVAAQELVREIRGKIAYLLNVVDLEDPTYSANDVAEYKKARPDNDVPFEAGNAKIQVYACPQTIFDQILDIIMKNEHDITALADGNDVVITKHANKDKLKTRYSVTAMMKTTASDVGPDAELPELSQVGFVMKFDDMVNLLTEGVGGDYAALLPSGDSAPALTSGKATSVNENAAAAADAATLEAAMQKELASA